MKKNTFIIIFLALLGVLLITPLVLFAAKMPSQVDWPSISGKTLFQGNKVPMLPSFVNYFYTMALAIAGLIIFWVFIWSGFEWYMSAGNAGKVQNAKNSMWGAIIGTCILLVAFLILQTINPTLTELKLTTSTSGFILENTTTDERMIIGSNAPDVSMVSPSVIKVPYDWWNANALEVTLFSGARFSGEGYVVKKSDWTCPPSSATGDKTPKECYMQYPEKYRNGSIISTYLRPGVYVLKVIASQDENNKLRINFIPFYINGDASNLNDIPEFRGISGEVKAVKIYNPTNADFHYGVIVWTENNYREQGFVYIPPNKAGWSEPAIYENKGAYGITVSVWNMRSAKAFKVYNYGEAKFVPYYAPEKMSGKICKTRPTGQFVTEIDCKNSESYPNALASFDLYGGNVVLFEQGQLELKYPGIFSYFTHAELFKTSDPHLSDNEEIGRCWCRAVFLACDWQSCADHAIYFPTPQ